MTLMLLVHVILIFFAALLFPSSAFAWGPGTHVELAMGALGAGAAIAPIIRDIIRKFPEAFIYGMASPDIVIGKKYAGYIHHCHNWRMGWLILHEAETDRQRAAAYGYLSHLAADVVAHNYFIPVKIVLSYDARLLSHTYWEMRFDLGVADFAWDKLKMITELEIEEFDLLLERVLQKTLFSFSTNKRIFNSILMLQKMRGLRASLMLYASKSRFEIEQEGREHYFDLALESVLDFLSDPEKAPCLEIDPTGDKKISYAKNLRRRVREMVGREIMTQEDAGRLVELTREGLAVGLYRPDIRLPDVVDVL
jgi:hypothetical protein